MICYGWSGFCKYVLIMMSMFLNVSRMWRSWRDAWRSWLNALARTKKNAALLFFVVSIEQDGTEICLFSLLYIYIYIFFFSATAGRGLGQSKNVGSWQPVRFIVVQESNKTPEHRAYDGEWQTKSQLMTILAAHGKMCPASLVARLDTT